MKNAMKVLVLLVVLSGGTEVLGSNSFRINQGRKPDSMPPPYTIVVNQALAAKCDAPTTASLSVLCEVDYSKALSSPLLTIRRGRHYCVIDAIVDIEAITIGRPCFKGVTIDNGNINLQP
jgi:hypothetical protein